MKKIYNTIIKSIYKKLAIKTLQNAKVKIIGVTGSVGKSSAKEAIFTVLNEDNKYKGKVLKSVGNLNNEIGLPLTILGYKSSPKFYIVPFLIILSYFRSIIKNINPLKNILVIVLEYAADNIGDISYLTSIARPNVGVITYIGEAHMEFFGSRDNIIKEKSAIFGNLKESEYAIINADIKESSKILKELVSNKMSYGLDPRADLCVRDVSMSENNTKFQLLYLKEKYKIELNTVGMSQVYAALSGIAVGIIFDLKIEDIINSLKKIKALEGRDDIKKGIKNSVVIDSSYNANPSSVKNMLEILKLFKTKGKKIAVLGDMRELGNISKTSHEEIGKIAKKNANIVVAVGEESKVMKSDYWFADSTKASDFVYGILEENDVVLVKGSHAISMDKIVKKIVI